MSEIYKIKGGYLPTVPEYIQDIVSIHNFRYRLHSEEARRAFDWYMDYLSQYPHHSYPQAKPTIVQD